MKKWTIKVTKRIVIKGQWLHFNYCYFPFRRTLSLLNTGIADKKPWKQFISYIVEKYDNYFV